MPERNYFSWNTMIEGYMNSGDKVTSLKVFDMMPERNVYSWNVVVSGFAKSGELSVARRLFDAMPEKDVKTLNSLLHGYSVNGYAEEALRLFKELKFSADVIIMTTLLGACAKLEALNCGKQVHARILISGVEYDSKMNSSLVNLYAKCGDLRMVSSMMDQIGELDEHSLSALITGYASCGKVNESRILFDKIGNRCVCLWNSMISGYVANSMEMEALVLYKEMRNEAREDCRTMASVISACGNLSLAETGKQMHGRAFKVGLIDDIVVVSTLIDMYSECGRSTEACEVFARAGYLDEAIELIEDMPFDADATMWSSVLRGCVANGDKNMGKKVAEKIIDLEPENSVAYVQLSAILASSGDWENSACVRKQMKEKHVRKNPGTSWG
ncbi:hypothetical protein AALP_AA2G211700 [Arabis alpina]|uniref:Pentatricopeptide repeat-containing protein n=1 Tax=Arabis alpina TaxID=50452 RepID=A0A087HJ03_ARAAL|nr:hypothetical protein AALP_AA2G211700 [Arabis alpina]